MSAKIRGKTYHYMMGESKSRSPVGTMLLMHGFPDLGFGWRYQVPYLVCLGYRVVVPDLLGYARSSRPRDVCEFSMKSMSMDMIELARRIAGDEQIILGGHDWGGHLAWRVAMWHPNVVKAMFSVSTPFLAPTKPFISMVALVAPPYNLKNFKYILQFKGREIGNAIRNPARVREFINAMYGGLDPQGEPGWQVTSGVAIDKLDTLSRSPLVSDEELNHYTGQFMLQESPPMRGPLSWYRTRKINWKEERELAEKQHLEIAMPSLFIAAARDEALPPALSVGMERYVPKLSRREVDSGHWALWETSSQVNEMIGEWLRANVSSEASSGGE